MLTASQPFTSALVMSNPKWFRYEWIWQKTMSGNFLHANRQPLKKHENILLFYKKQPVYNPIKTKGDVYTRKGAIGKSNIYNKITGKIVSDNFTITNSGRFPISVIQFENGNNKNVHPTQKPVALFEYLIKTYTNEGDLVLDNVAGSGTTGVACQNLNRDYILIEKEPEYVEIIKQRLRQ